MRGEDGNVFKSRASHCFFSSSWFHIASIPNKMFFVDPFSIDFWTHVRIEIGVKRKHFFIWLFDQPSHSFNVELSERNSLKNFIILTPAMKQSHSLSWKCCFRFFQHHNWLIHSNNVNRETLTPGPTTIAFITSTPKRMPIHTMPVEGSSSRTSVGCF